PVSELTFVRPTVLGGGNSMKRTLFAFAALAVTVVIILGSAQPAFSQVAAAQAQLNGTVKDQAGGVIVKATVILKNEDTNHVYTTATNSDGYYILANIPPGNYELSAEFTGFGKSVQKNVVLRVAQAATIDINLKVAAASEVVEVKTDAPII